MKNRISLLIPLLILIFSMSVITKADEISTQNGSVGIVINEKNFPGVATRRAVWEYADRNGDFILTDEEIKNTTYMYVGWELFEKDINTSKEWDGTIDCSGIEKFTNLKTVILDAKLKGKEIIKSFDNIYQLNNLKELFVRGNKQTKKYNFGKVPNLKKLKIEYVTTNKIIIKNDKLKTFNVSILDVGKFQIKSANNLKKLDEFGGIKVRTLDLSKLVNLKSADIGLRNTKRIKFGKLKRLRTLSLSGPCGTKKGWRGNKALKTLDLSELKNLMEVNLSNLLKLTKIKCRKNHIYNDFSVFNCSKLKKINASNVKIKESLMLDRWTKPMNISKENKKVLKYWKKNEYK